MGGVRARKDRSAPGGGASSRPTEAAGTDVSVRWFQVTARGLEQQLIDACEEATRSVARARVTTK